VGSGEFDEVTINDTRNALFRSVPDLLNDSMKYIGGVTTHGTLMHWVRQKAVANDWAMPFRGACLDGSRFELGHFDINHGFHSLHRRADGAMRDGL